jgi:chromosome partitioning protein
MPSIAIMNQKGGVGKTTTAVNLSAALADLGQRVCLVDLDPQSHASLHLGVELSGDEPSVYDILLDNATLKDVWRPVDDRLWVVGSHINLAAAAVELADVAHRETVLRQRLSRLSDPVDYLLIDCPPSLGLLTINAMAAVDEVLIPLQPHFLALHGLSRLLETVELIAGRINTRLSVAGVVLCMYDASTRLASEVADDVSAFFEQSREQAVPWSGARAFETRIRRNIRLAEAPSFGQSIFQYAPRSNGAEDYRRLAEELLQQRG